MLPIISKDARLVVWPGVGAVTANMNYVILEPGEANTPHVHAESEDSVFILDGKGSVQDFDNDRRLEFEARPSRSRAGGSAPCHRRRSRRPGGQRRRSITRRQGPVAGGGSAQGRMTVRRDHASG